MKLSPLQMAYYRVTKYSVTALPEHDPEHDDIDALMEHMHVMLNLEHMEEGDTEYTTEWLVGLGIDFDPSPEDKAPYAFRTDIFGIFSCAKELPPGMDAEKLVGINGSSMLYGITRELLLGITEKSMWGGMFLPSMSFTDYKDMLKLDDVELT